MSTNTFLLGRLPKLINSSFRNFLSFPKSRRKYKVSLSTTLVVTYSNNLFVCQLYAPESVPLSPVFYLVTCERLRFAFSEPVVSYQVITLDRIASTECKGVVLRLT